MQATELFKLLHKNASTAMSQLRQAALSPNTAKVLREWGISDAARMIERTPQTLRTYEDQNKIPKARTVLKGKRVERVYNLKEINILRETFNTRPSKPKGIPPLILAITNFKGGATKSTQSIHIAQNFALKGYKVLLIDGDAQGTSTHNNGYIPDSDISADKTLLNILTGSDQDISKIIIPTHWDGLDLIPANLSLFNAELIIPQQIAQYAHETGKTLDFYGRLHKKLKNIYDKYDMILLDTPPSLGFTTMNILYAANTLIIPFPPNVVDFASTKQFLNMVFETFERLPGKTFAFVRFMISRYKTNSTTTNTFEQFVRHHLGQYLMTNSMIESEAVFKASAELKTIYEVEPHPNERKTYRRAIDYQNRVCDEIEMLGKIMWQNFVNAKKTKEAV